MKDERYKEIMERLGMPNSQSLLTALQQIANESVQEEIKKLQQIVNEQAEDERLWFSTQYASEAYLQQALRKLHEIIEDKTREECAVEILNKI